MSLLLCAGCDAFEPSEVPILVVEGFFDADRPLPELILRHTQPIYKPYQPGAGTAASEASVRLVIGKHAVSYDAVAEHPGRYAPESPHDTTVARQRTPFVLDVNWQGQQARGEGIIPPPIQLDSILVDVPEEPVQAILLDSLQLSDSLDVGARKGFIYPVEVTLWWSVDFAEVGADSLYWIQTQLKPYTPFSSTVVDFFLRPEQVLRERTIPRDASGRRRWTGVYAVPVERRTDALPAHRLKVSLLRSGQAYARFAASRDDPERREPYSNVEGALGIVAGISVDSMQVHVE